MTRSLERSVGLVLVVVALAACATMEAKREPTLYDRLGGRDPIGLVVDTFVGNVVADNRINARFKKLKFPEVERFKSYLADQICQASGGPCSYVGRDMKTAHKGMKITDAEWNATVEALVKALDKHKVPLKEKNELIGLLGPMKADIVGQ